jgi:hypothetical protein
MNVRSVIVLSALISASAFAATTDNQATPGSNTSATGSSASTGTNESKPRHGDCIFTRTIDGWTVLDDQSLIVYAPTHSTPYLVKLWRPEFDLKWANTLGFVDRDNNGMICDGGPDSILLRDFGRGFSNRVPVNSVQRLNQDQAKELIAKSKAKPESPAPVMPDQSDMKSDKSGAQKPDQSDQSQDQPKT